jgi:hypothetical protein
MRDASKRPDQQGFTCDSCGRFIVTAIDGLWQARNAGSPRRFCDPACRQAAYRRRQAGAAEDTPLQKTGGRNRHLTTNNKETKQPPTPRN